MFLQLPSPTPYTPQPNPTIPGGGYGGSGSYLNPQSYAGLAHELGPAWFVLFIFSVMLFLACGYMIWRSWRQPSNAAQLAFLKAMYIASNQRHAQWQAAMRHMCLIFAAIAKKQDIDLNGKLDALREVLVSPPPVHGDLLTVLDDATVKGATDAT